MARAPVFAAIIAAMIALTGCSRFAHWSEEVRLHDGTILWVDRTLTREVGIVPETSTISRISITFEREKRRYKWTQSLVGGSDLVPVILDFVDSQPVVVFPVARFEACSAFGFPAEGLVAYRFDGRTWQRQDVARLPSTLRANLLTSTSYVEHPSPPQDTRITSENKAQWEPGASVQGASVPGQGTPLPDLIRFYSEYDDACAEMRPPPDPARDALSARLQQAEQAAVPLEAALIDDAGLRNAIIDALGKKSRRWTGYGFISAQCDDVIETIDGVPVIDPTNPDRLTRIDEIRWKRRNGRRTRAQLPQGGVDVVCDEHVVYVARHDWRSGRLVIYRFTRDGEFRDALAPVPSRGHELSLNGGLQSIAVNGDRVIFVWGSRTTGTDPEAAPRQDVYSTALPHLPETP